MKFKLKDIVLLAIMAAVLLLVCAPVAPIVMTVTKLGVQAVAMAFGYAVVNTVALRAVPKPGALVIVGLFSGLVLLFMAPVMFFNQVVSAIAAEAVALLIFRHYRNEKAITVAAALNPFFTVPITGVFNYFAKGRSFVEQIGGVGTFILAVAGALILGFFGAWVGHKIADALQRAGKLPAGE